MAANPYHHDRHPLEGVVRTQHILVVEDDHAIRSALHAYLQRHEFTVDAVGSGEEALPLAPRADLMVLDVRLPGMDGFEVLRRVRGAQPALSVLLLTARTDDLDKIVALEMGADDYMTKPFNPREVVARIRAVLRRAGRAPDPVATGNSAAGAAAPERLASAGVVVDLTAHTVTVDEQEVAVTPREFQILATLLAQPGRAYSRDELLTALWGENHVGDPKTVDVYVRRLRDKIELDAADPKRLLTVWGIGYKFAGGGGLG